MKTRKLAITLALCLLTLAGVAQKAPQYTEDDVKQFYRTIIGDYYGYINDSTAFRVHFTPIWETPENRFQWMYLEASNERNEVVLQKVVEVQPISDKSFNLVIHGLKDPSVFAGKWANRNFFDGFTTSILKGKSRYTFVKTSDFNYQTSWNGAKKLGCFPQGDRVHFKFTQENECFYIKRMPKKSTHIIGINFQKELTD